MKSHFSLVISRSSLSEKMLEEVLTDEKLPHLAEDEGRRGMSVWFQWARVASSKPTQPRSHIRPSRIMISDVQLGL
jgi:hypothetical protein